MNTFDDGLVKETMDWIKATTKQQNEIPEKALEKVTRLYLAMKGKADGRFYNDNGAFKLFLQHGNTKPNPKWTELGWKEPTPDFPAALLEVEMSVPEYIDKVPGQHVIMVFGDVDIKQIKMRFGSF